MTLPTEFHRGRGGPDVRGPWPIIDTLAKILPNFRPPNNGGATIPVWGDFSDGGTVTASLRSLRPDFETILRTLPSGYEILGLRSQCTNHEYILE